MLDEMIKTPLSELSDFKLHNVVKDNLEDIQNYFINWESINLQIKSSAFVLQNALGLDALPITLSDDKIPEYSTRATLSINILKTARVLLNNFRNDLNNKDKNELERAIETLELFEFLDIFRFNTNITYSQEQGYSINYNWRLMNTTKNVDKDIFERRYNFLINNSENYKDVDVIKSLRLKSKFDAEDVSPNNSLCNKMDDLLYSHKVDVNGLLSHNPTNIIVTIVKRKIDELIRKFKVDINKMKDTSNLIGLINEYDSIYIVEDTGVLIFD